MKVYSFKKNIAEIGEVEYKIASSREDLEQAFSLIYKEYLTRGFILPKYYKSGLRITLNNIVPGTTVFVAMKNKEVVATNAIIPDSELGLPLDMGYRSQADGLRKSGRKICEAGYLAIKTDLFGRGYFSMFNFKKLDFMFTLFKLMFQYALNYAKFDDLCIVTNPRYTIFKFLPFETIGPIKYYGYDHVAVKKKAAVFKRLDLAKMRKYINNPVKIIGQRYALYKIFLKDRIPQELYLNEDKFNRKDLRYFFVEKSDILKNMKRPQQEYIKSWYKLSEDEFRVLMKRGMES